jgi:phosphatidate phosphatase APP1
VVIAGRALEKHTFQKETEKDNWFQNLWRKAKRFNNREIKKEPVTAVIGEKTYVVTGDKEGYFNFDIQTKKALRPGYQKIKLQLPGNPSFSQCNAAIFGNKKYVGIISDVDDTVIVSHVTKKMKLLANTFFKNYKQRKAVPGMAERFRKILGQNPSHAPSALFFLSGSPNQLSAGIEKFLAYHHFPKHILLTKKIHGKASVSLFEQFHYKTKKIETLIKMYPKMKWVLFGDSGENDKEVYAYIRKKYPDKVKDIFIRDVKSGIFAKE